MFPDGDWTGYWSHDDDGAGFVAWEHRLRLSFDAETVSGRGTDLVGLFDVSGTARGDRVEVTKRYVGLHDVGYSGRLGFRGCVVGWWRLGSAVGGRFIWVPPGATNAVELAEAYALTLR